MVSVGTRPVDRRRRVGKKLGEMCGFRVQHAKENNKQYILEMRQENLRLSYGNSVSRIKEGVLLLCSAS